MSECKFSVGLKYQSDLEAGELSEAFRQEFESNSFVLSHDLTIETQEEHDTWRIKENDSGQTYIVRRQDEALNVILEPPVCKECDRDREATGKLVSSMFSRPSLCLRQLLSHVLEASEADSCAFAVHESQDGRVPFALNGQWHLVCEETNPEDTSEANSGNPIEAYLARLNKNEEAKRPEDKLQDEGLYIGEVTLRNEHKPYLVIQPLVSDIVGDRRSSRLCLLLLNPSPRCVWGKADAGIFAQYIQPMAAPVQTWLWWVHYQRARLQECCRRMSQGIDDKGVPDSIFKSLVRLHTLRDIVTYANKGLLLRREDEDAQDKFLTDVMSLVEPECATHECWHDHDCLQPPWRACHEGKKADRKVAKALLSFCPWTSGARRECAEMSGYFTDKWPQIVRDRLWGCRRADEHVERQEVDPHFPDADPYVKRQGVDPDFLDKGALSRFFAAEYLAADRHSAYVDESVKYLGSEERGRSLAHMGRVFQHLLAKTPLDWRTIEGLVWMISEYSHEHLEIDPRLDIAAHLLQAARNEPALHAMRDFYRDHFMHAIEVCFLGHLLLITHDQNGKALWQHVAEQPGVVREPGEWREEPEPGPDEGGITLKHVLRQWYVAALLHDVGYAIDIFRALQEMLEFYSHPEEMESFRESLEDALEALSASDQMKVIMASVLGLKNADNLGRDHGVIAATYLRGLLQHLERDKDPGSYDPAIRAIGVHNDRRASVNFETDPLGVLLVLCDTIQEWGRPYLRHATAPSMLLARLLTMDGDQEDITGPLRTTSLNVTRCGEPNPCPKFQLDGDSLEVSLAYDEGIQDNAGVFNLWIDASCNLQRLILDSFPFNVKVEFKTPCFRVLGRGPQSQMSRLRDAAAETHMHFLHDWLPSSPDGSNVTDAVRHSLEKISEFVFSVGLKYQSGLEAGELSEAFRQEFKSNGVTLSQDLTIETQVEHDEWRIKENDSGRTYIVRRQDEALSVYISDFGFDTLTLDLRRLADPRKKAIASDVDRFRDRLKRWKRFNEDRDFEGDYSPLLPGR